MAKRVRKLTAESLKRMILEEAKKIQLETSDPLAAGIEKPEKVKAEETDAEPPKPEPGFTSVSI